MTKQTAATAEATSAVSSSPIHLGPPFTSAQGWTFARTPDPAGFWTAVKPDPWNGGWVQQLGAKTHPANTPLTRGDLLVTFNHQRNLPAGTQSFLLRLELGPVSLRTNGGTAAAHVVFQLRGPSFNWADIRPAASNSVMYLDITPPFALNAGLYNLRFGGYLLEQYQGAQNPYAEIICRRAEVLYFPPRSVSAAESAQAASAPAEILEDGLKLDLQEFDPQQAIALRDFNVVPLAG